jgi:ABC-2 type transport system permease protein
MPRSEIYDESRARRVIATFSARRAARPGLLWGLVFGATIAATMSTYDSSFPTAADRAEVARSVEGNAAFEALFGLTRRLDTVAGYTAYKTMYTLLIIGAIWGVFVATRLLRGEEESGRWELLLSGATTRGRAASQVAAGLGIGAIALWVPTALLSVAVGASSSVDIGVGPSLFFATAVTSAVVMFMAVGMLASQLAATRHDANLIGAAVLAAAYFVRMVADSDPAVGWLRWVSPLGWIEELRPLVGSRPLAFVPIVAFTAVLTYVAIRIARHRDLGASAFRGNDSRPPRTLLLNGPGELSIRLTWPAVVGWLTVFAAVGLVFGLVTQAAGKSLRGSPTLERVIARLGATGAGAVTYLGFVFLIAAGLVAIAVAGQISALRNEEADGHLDNLLARPVARSRWLLARVAVGLVLVVAGSALTGVAAWVGAATQHAAVGFGDLVEAGLNVAPPAVFVLGVGVLAYGLVPRAAIAITYGLIIWSFMVEVLASVSDSSHWLRDTSPLLHITPAPAADPNWTAAVWLVALGLLATIAGITAFARRDLQGA